MNYYNEIYKIVEKREVNKKVREIKDNSEKLMTYWNIGKLISEAQESDRAKYGDYVIKKWANQLTAKFGSGYGIRKLFKSRKLYQTFPIVSALPTQLTLSHFDVLFPLKTQDKINYYINETIQNNLGYRQLEDLIKSNAYERLPEDTKNNIKVIENKYEVIPIKDNLKNPISIIYSKL